MSKKELVLAFFANEEAAEVAVNEMKKWDKASKDIKLGSIAVLVQNKKGKIKKKKLGARHTGTGIAAGVLAGLLSGGVTLLGGMLVGGIAGSLIHKGMGMSKEDLARIGGELDNGRAAVVILANPDETAAVSAKLAELGGEAESYEVSEAVVEEVEAAVEEAPEAAAAEEESEA
jgi:uncharacterized membrane protein